MKKFSWFNCVIIAYLIASPPVTQAADSAGSCSPYVAQWLDPESNERLDTLDVFNRLGGSGIVLLGEAHTNAAHHLWQHYMLAALHSRQTDLILGLEMLPRRMQPVLDDWSAGLLDEAEFLVESEWDELWGYDANLYLPLLHFAKLNRLPTVAINIDRRLVSRVGQEGWQAIPASERMGLSDPRPASDDYRKSLAELYLFKQRMFHPVEAEAVEDPAEELAEVQLSEAFNNFVDAQLTWDRGMAETLAEAHRLDPDALVVGIVGRGHLEYGYGIPHQLAGLGVEKVTVLLPIDADDSCADMQPNLADAVFVVDAQADQAGAAGPRLGVMIEDSASGVQVKEVIDESVAEDAGLRVGDIIKSAAGFDTTTTSELIEVIRRQAQGTWLPLLVVRDGSEREMIARFPQQFD